MLFLYWVSLPGLPAIALWVQNQIPGVKNLYPWAFPLIVFIGVLLVFAVWGLVRVRHRLLVLETPVLKVSDYSSKNDRGHSWISLFVENPTDIPIPDCQGEVREWRIIQADTAPILPAQPTTYPWSSRTGDQEPNYTRPIGAYGHDILDLVSSLAKGEQFSSVRALNVPGPRRDHSFDWPMGPGEYQALVEIGSKTWRTKPTYVSVWMRLNLDGEWAKVTVTEVSPDYLTRRS